MPSTTTRPGPTVRRWSVRTVVLGLVLVLTLLLAAMLPGLARVPTGDLVPQAMATPVGVPAGAP